MLFDEFFREKDDLLIKHLTNLVDITADLFELVLDFSLEKLDLTGSYFGVLELHRDGGHLVGERNHFLAADLDVSELMGGASEEALLLLIELDHFIISTHSLLAGP